MKRYLEISAGHVSGRILLERLILLSAALLVTSCGEKSLSDADVERLLKEAVDFKSLEVRNDLFYQGDKPYSGWAKKMSHYDSGQAQVLGRLKDGKADGPRISWHETGEKKGEKKAEGTFKDGKPDGPWTYWHENGQKLGEVKYKDGELISERYWNSKGEEVGSEKAAYGY